MKNSSLHLILTLLLITAASPYSYGQACPGNAWCQTYAGGGGTPGDFGWNHLVYVPDSNTFYLYAIAHGGQTPFESALTTYQHQTQQLVSANPWKTKTDCGNGADGSPSSIMVCNNAGCTTNSTNSQGSNNPNKDHQILIGNGSGGPLQSTDMSVALTYGSQYGQQLINHANPTFTSTGTLIIDNEAIDYSAIDQGNACGTKPYSGPPACAGAAMSGNCLGSTCSVFTLSARGVRRGAAFGAAASHLGGGLSAGAEVHQACANPQIDMGDGLGLRSTLTAIPGGGDNPAVRHVARNYSYSRLNHRIMMVGGYHENFEFTDTWFLCLSVGGACTQDLVNRGWQLMITPHNIGKRQETQTAYDDTANAFIEFGGLQDPGGQNTPTLWVNCPVVNTAAGCTAANDWFSVTNTTCNGPDCTSNHMPPWRHGAQMRYMPDSGQIIMFGGFGTGGLGGSNQPLADIWIYNANARTWTEGTTFPGLVGDFNFSPTAWPAFAYDTARHLAVLYGGPGSVYAYNPVADSWNSIAVPGGPQLDTVDQGEPSRTLEYDSADDVYVFVQQGGLNGVNAGNADTWELPASVVPQQGQTLPIVTIATPTTGASISGTIMITSSASSPKGISKVGFLVDGSPVGAANAPPYSTAWDTTKVSSGTHRISAVATDLAGNTGTFAVTVQVTNNAAPDTTPPTVSIISPAQGSTVAGTVSLMASATDNVSVASVSFKVDGNPVGTANKPPYSIAWDTTTVSSGTHRINAIATDLVGNTGTSSIAVQVINNSAPDTTPPTVSVTSPAQGSTVAGKVSLMASATDNVSVAFVSFKVDGNAVGSKDTNPPYSASWDTTGSSNGSHMVTATASDLAGNLSSSSVAVTVNNSSPPAGLTVTIISPGANTSASGTIVVSADVNSANGISSVVFRVDGSVMGTVSSPNGTSIGKVFAPQFSLLWDTTHVKNGKHVLTVVATDNARITATASMPISVSNKSGQPFFTFVQDTPTDNIAFFTIITTAATLTNAAGQSVSIANGARPMEFRHLELAPTLAFQTNVPPDNYSALKLSFANPQIMVRSSTGKMVRLNGSTTPSVRLGSSNVRVPLAVSVSGVTGLMFDFDLQRSITIDGNGNYIVNPVISALVTDNSSPGQLEDTLGQIVSVASGENVQTFDVSLLDTGIVVRVRTDAKTFFGTSIGQFSNLSAGQVIELDAQLQQDGTFLASLIDAGPPDPSRSYHGLLSSMQQASGGSTTNAIMNLVVEPRWWTIR